MIVNLSFESESTIISRAKVGTLASFLAASCAVDLNYYHSRVFGTLGAMSPAAPKIGTFTVVKRNLRNFKLLRKVFKSAQKCAKSRRAF